MNQFCEIKGIKREYSVARSPQQNGVTKRRNRTLIGAARTMLADSKLPTTFWAEAVNTACYVQNRVLVVKPHNKTPYDLFHGRTPALSFRRPFGCHVIILNTIDHLGKFYGKVDKGFFVGYSLNSKAFKVFNNRIRTVEESLHIRFSENTPNFVGSRPDWLFDIDALTKIMNYQPIVAGTQSNGFADTKASVNADPKRSDDDASKPSSDDGKKVDEDLRKENEKMHALEVDSIPRDDEDDILVADMSNLDTTIQVSPTPTTRIHKDHPLEQMIGDVQSVEEPKKVIHALKDPSWIEYMQEELLHFRLQEVWTLVELPNGKRAIGTKWVFRNKKDERGIVIRNKERLVTQGYIQEEKIDYD
ncbi:retrovirus-related pol polyprotein from transposon TNT 1-94, partial [Tanacetum coccineum]